MCMLQGGAAAKGLNLMPWCSASLLGWVWPPGQHPNRQTQKHLGAHMTLNLKGTCLKSLASPTPACIPFSASYDAATEWGTGHVPGCSSNGCSWLGQTAEQGMPGSGRTHCEVGDRARVPGPERSAHKPLLPGYFPRVRGYWPGAACLGFSGALKLGGSGMSSSGDFSSCVGCKSS